MSSHSTFYKSLSACIALLLAAELAVRWLSPSLLEPTLWMSKIVQTKVHQMDEIRAREGSVDLVFAGSSTMMFASNPSVVAGANDVSSAGYNAAIYGGIPRLTELWLLDQVLPRIDPEVVVLGLNTFDLYGFSRQHELEAQYLGAPMTMPGVAGAFRRILLSTSLFKFRTALRHPDQLASDVRDRLSDAAQDRTVAGVGARGESTLVFEDPEAVERDFRDILMRHFRDGFVADREQFHALERVLKVLNSREVEVVVVSMPTTASFTEIHPQGVRDVRAFKSSLREMVHAHGAVYLDPPAHLRRAELFFDSAHMNRDGAEKFSEWLGGELASLRPGPIHP